MVNEIQISRIKRKIDNGIESTELAYANLPTSGTAGSAGIDFYVPLNLHPLAEDSQVFKIPANQSILIPSGIKAKVPEGYALIAMNKSGIATKKKLIVGACVIDSDYQGEIHIHLISQNDKDVELNTGEKIVQFLLVPVEHCSIKEVPEKELFDSKTERGEGGFGSTGV